MNKLYIAIATLGLLGFLGGAYVLTNKPDQTYFPEVAKVNTNTAKIADHTKWNGKNVLVEYADLQCPSCKAFHDFLDAEFKKDPEFKKTMETNFKFVYRQFPLVNIHKNAQAAALAAEAAGLQGKFFEFIDAAYTSQSSWEGMPNAMDEFTKYAKDLGLDIQKFTADTQLKSVKDKIDADVKSGLEAQLQGTPTFYLNGNKMAFASFEEFKTQLIDAAKK